MPRLDADIAAQYLPPNESCEYTNASDMIEEACDDSGDRWDGLK